MAVDRPVSQPPGGPLQLQGGADRSPKTHLHSALGGCAQPKTREPPTCPERGGKVITRQRLAENEGFPQGKGVLGTGSPLRSSANAEARALERKLPPWPVSLFESDSGISRQTEPAFVLGGNRIYMCWFKRGR